MILRGIVAGGEIDGAVEIAAHDLMGHRRGGRKRLAQQRTDVVMFQNVHGELSKFLGIEARIVTDED